MPQARSCLCGVSESIKIIAIMKLLAAFALFFLASVDAASADTKGVIGGRVTDPQGAALSQAVVALTNTLDGRNQQTTTSDEGAFEFRFVEVGEYEIYVSAKGFSPVVVRTVVTSGQRVEVNVSLKEIRTASEEVTVSATSDALD